MSAISPLWVVKLGGSLERAPELPSWLRVLADAGRGRVVVVPGGGSFAEEVRRAQAHWQFGDAAAHRMAVLAMEQYGCMLAALEPELLPAGTGEAIAAGLSAGRTVLWQPAAMVLADPAIAIDWEMTSDSLAAWLAGLIGATGLALVKSAPPPAGAVTCASAAAAGVVDLRLRQFLIDHRIEACWLGRADHRDFAAVLEGRLAPRVPLRA